MVGGHTVHRAGGAPARKASDYVKRSYWISVLAAGRNAGGRLQLEQRHRRTRDHRHIGFQQFQFQLQLTCDVERGGLCYRGFGR